MSAKINKSPKIRNFFCWKSPKIRKSLGFVMRIIHMGKMCDYAVVYVA